MNNNIIIIDAIWDNLRTPMEYIINHSVNAETIMNMNNMRFNGRHFISGIFSNSFRNELTRTFKENEIYHSN